MIYDYIVIGAGVEGSSTAYYIASNTRGSNVLLLEQFDALHTRGSSHGGSRMAANAYHEPFLVELMEPCYKMWRDVEKASGKRLYVDTGVLAFGDADQIEYYSSKLTENKVDHNLLTASDVNSLYSKQLKLPNGYLAVYAKRGGLVRAAVAVATFQQLFVKCGGTLIDRCQVTNVQPGEIIQLQTSKGGVFKTKKLVITAGAWTNKVLEGTKMALPLKPVRTEALYWSTQNPDDFSTDAFTMFLYVNKNGYFDYYGLPWYEYEGFLRIAYHYGDEIPDPASRDKPSNKAIQTRQNVSNFIQKHFKGVDDKPSIIEPCMYTVTPDLYPIIDVHPSYSNIVIGAGFSGKGFKFAPIVGKLLYELLEQNEPSVELRSFSLNRFTKASL